MKLRTKFILFTTVLVFVFSAVIIFDRVQSSREALLGRTQDRVDYITAFLTDMAGEALEKGETVRLKEKLKNFENFKQIAYLRVSDTRGHVLYRRAEPGISIENRTADKDIFDVTDKVFDTRSDIVRNGSRYGYMEMGVSVTGISEITENLMWRGIAISLIFIAVIMLVVWLLTLRLGRELSALNELAENVNADTLPAEDAFSHGTETWKIAQTLAGLHSRLKEEETRRGNAETQKDDFFSMTVHDLKQPVTALKASLDLLLSEEESKTFSKEQLRNLAQIARTSLGMLVTMIGDVLNTAKLNNADYQPEKERLVLEDFLRECAGENAASVRAAGKRWALALAPEIKGAWLFGDHDLIKRVIGNLVLNAIQYTPAGGAIKLGARIRENGKAAIYVSDEGEGIPENFREEIFRKYSTMGKSYKNIGLGLAFCKMVADRHAAMLDVQSETGKGTEISFIIPVSFESNGPEKPAEE